MKTGYLLRSAIDLGITEPEKIKKFVGVVAAALYDSELAECAFELGEYSDVELELAIQQVIGGR